MAKHYSEKQRNLPPSKRKYANHMQVPDGCVDVWRINIVDHSGRPSIHSQWMDRDLCMSKADHLHEQTKEPKWSRRQLEFVYVEHKAAVQIGGKWHIINIPSFKFAESAEAEKQPTKEDDHTEWLRQFEGTPKASCPGEGIHHEIDYKHPDEE